MRWLSSLDQTYVAAHTHDQADAALYSRLTFTGHLPTNLSDSKLGPSIYVLPALSAP
jgi:hypothetical protein